MRQMSSSTGDVASGRMSNSAPLTPVCGPFGDIFSPRLLSEPVVNQDEESPSNKIAKQNSMTAKDSPAADSAGEEFEKGKFGSRNYSFKENLRNVLRSSKRMNSLPAPVHGPRFGAISPKGMNRKETISQSIDETLAEKDKESNEDKNE